MSDEPVTLSEALAAAEREKESLKERLRESEAEAGKLPSLHRENENLQAQVEKQRVRADNADAKVAELEAKVSDLETNSRAEGEDAERIHMLEQALEDKDTEIENLKSDFQKQATAHNTLQEQATLQAGELERLGAVDAAAKQLLDALEKLGNTD